MNRNLAACLALLTCCGCDGNGLPTELPEPCDRVGHPDFTGSGRGAIGPQGGVVEVTEPTSFIPGVRVEVAPGAWTECWEVKVLYASIFETPDYPTGFEPFERPYPSGAVDIQIGLTTSDGFYRAQDPLPISISFPMSTIQPGPLDVRSAFFYDDEQPTWRIVFPQALSPERLTVETTRHELLWSWGRVTVGEVDYDQHLRPAMEAYIGSQTMLEIQASLDELRRQAEQQSWTFDCIGLAAGQGFFAGCRDQAYNGVDQLQASYGCGPCNPLTQEFQEGFEEYWEVAKWQVALDIGDLMFPPSKPLELIAAPLLQVAEDELFNLFEPNTPCDYDCYFEHTDAAIYVGKALYYGCDWISKAFELFRTQYMNPPCPP